MHISCLSIFPELYEWFFATSLIGKAVAAKTIWYSLINPRTFCDDPQQQIDDYPYWWWAWLVLKARPMIDALRYAIESRPSKNFEIIFLAPSQDVFTQKTADALTSVDHLIVVSWRYEWIDHRFELWAWQTYPEQFRKISLWSFVTLWGEIPSMALIEATVRLLPWVIGQEASWQYESYRSIDWLVQLEHPHYTRPQQVAWLSVPDVLLSWNHAAIEQRRKDNATRL